MYSLYAFFFISVLLSVLI